MAFRRQGAGAGSIPGAGSPPRRLGSRTSHYVQQWTRKSIWVRINDALRRRVRVGVERRENVEATAGVIDTQSAKRSLAGGPERGFDGGKQVYGRKRHRMGELEIVERLPGQQGFRVQPKRWGVERRL